MTRKWLRRTSQDTTTHMQSHLAISPRHAVRQMMTVTGSVWMLGLDVRNPWESWRRSPAATEERVVTPCLGVTSEVVFAEFPRHLARVWSRPHRHARRRRPAARRHPRSAIAWSDRTAGAGPGCVCVRRNRRPASHRANEMWHIDTTVIGLLDGTRAYLHDAIDNFSRRILA